MEYNLRKLVASMWEHRKNKDFERKSLESLYRGLSVKASIGMTGNIAKIPWISYCADGQETQKGIYPVLLFYGTPEFLEKNKNHTIVKKIILAYGISATKTPDVLWGAEVETKKTIGESFVDWKYETSDYGIKKYNSSYVYKTYDWTDDVDYDNIQNDIDALITVYLGILENVSINTSPIIPLKKTSFNASIYSIVKVSQSMLPYRSYITAIKSKPFLLLAGISGTGKSRIVRELARACWDVGSTDFKAQKPKNFEIVQVKPNWHDSSELIGYVSRIGADKDGNGVVFVAGDFLRFVAKAWENPEIPYFLCLDEMNLAPVEQYFAEYLSVIESRKADENGVITTDPILKKSGEDWYRILTSELTSDENVRNQFLNDGIAIPQNLIVIGTVNMDETTFSFSRKVLDRAMTIEMNEVNLKGGLDHRHEMIGKLGKTELIGETVEGVDVYSDFQNVCDIAIDYLQGINDNLEGTPFKVAYRTRNEVLLYVVNNLPYNKDSKGNALSQDYVIARALDEITSMKILSRIEGDETKVSASFLEGLENTIKTSLVTVCPNLFEEGEGKKAYVSVSLAKLTEMKKRLTSGYTSFWS